MARINQFYPVWGSSAGAKTKPAADDKIEEGWDSDETPIIEYINNLNKSLMDRLNQIIQLYANPTSSSIAYKDQEFEDDLHVSFGTSEDASIVYSTTDVSNPALHIGVPATNKGISILNKADLGTSVPSSSNNSLLVHGEDTDDFIGIFTGTTNLGLITSGNSDLRFKPTGEVFCSSTVGNDSHFLGVNDMFIDGQAEAVGNLFSDSKIVVVGAVTMRSAIAYGKPVVIDDSDGTSGSPFLPVDQGISVLVCDTSSGIVYVEIDEAGIDGQLLTVKRKGANRVDITWTSPASSDNIDNLVTPDACMVFRYSDSLGKWKNIGGVNI